MTRSKKKRADAAAVGNRAKMHHRKAANQRRPFVRPELLNARPEVPQVKSKHISYYELVENKDKKKKLEFEVTTNRRPPPGFEFVATGNPELTKACKELSREQDAMIFIVTTDKRLGSLGHHLNRVGHHVRESIVEQAHKLLGEQGGATTTFPFSGQPEPIPDTQEEINDQADKTMRDLFPRIPHTDRQMIIERSFRKGGTRNGEPLVGLAKDLTLSRRVQLAVLAHIRHTHTRYDQLLKETTYGMARKAVETLCLDILVKWRGDEETGRDQLDEILREVIVISDSEDDEDDYDDNDEDGSEDEDSVALSDSDYDNDEDDQDIESDDSCKEIPQPDNSFRNDTVVIVTTTRPRPAVPERQSIQLPTQLPPQRGQIVDYESYYGISPARNQRTETQRTRRGFKRYQAALLARWDEARNRVRLQEAQPAEVQTSIPSPTPASAPIPTLAMDTHYRADHDYSTSTRPNHTATRSNDFGHQITSAGGRSTYDYETAPIQDSRLITYSAPMPQRVLSNPLPRRQGILEGRERLPMSSMVRSEQARDLLVPSVEPLSPGVEPRPASIFVRAVSPTYSSRPQPTNEPREAPKLYGRRPSPGWEGDDYAHGKRRRVAEDDPPAFIRLSPQPGHAHPVYDRDSNLDGTSYYPPRIIYAADDLHTMPSRVPHRRDGWHRHSPSQPLNTLGMAPTAMPRRIGHDVHGGKLVEESSRTVIVERWDGQLPPHGTTGPPMRQYEDPRNGQVVAFQHKAFSEFDRQSRHDIPREPVPTVLRPTREETVEYRPVYRGPPAREREHHVENFAPYSSQPPQDASRPLAYATTPYGPLAGPSGEPRRGEISGYAPPWLESAVDGRQPQYEFRERRHEPLPPSPQDHQAEIPVHGYQEYQEYHEAQSMHAQSQRLPQPPLQDWPPHVAYR